MPEPIQRIDQTTVQDGNTVQTTREVQEPAVRRAHKQNVASRLVLFITGVVLTLLAFRFILILLGANPDNGFASFVYAVSHPLAAPFFNLFGYTQKYGVTRLEISSLFAMLVYGLIGYGLAKLLTITQDR